MKKKLEAELISIAHRILQLKNKSDLLQLHKEAQNLYEKLSLLKFVEENFAEAKPTIGYAEIESQIESAFEKEEEAKSAEVPETKQKASKKAAPSKEAVVEETHADETQKETTPTTSEAPVTEEEEPSEEQETVENKEEETTSTTSEEPVTEEEEPSEEQETVENKEEETTETKDAAEDEENPADEIEMPETPEQPEAIAEVNAALEYESADENETGEEEIPPAEDAGINEAGTSAPKEDDFMPSFELAFDKKEEPKEQKQIAFEDFLGHDYNESVFVKAGEAEQKKEESPVEEAEKPQTSHETEIHVNEAEVVEEQQPEAEKAEHKPIAAGDHLSKSISIGLNDRIGFEKQLFGGSSEDLNRVLSQLNTFDSFQEAQEFIEDMVKPDYNNWEGKDDYAQRFMDIVEKKFS